MTIVLQNAQPRLPAQPHALGAWLVYRALVKPALRRTFNRVLLDATLAQDVLRGEQPVLCYVTHCSWWDGYVGFELFRNVFPRNHFLMMEEAQLRRYFFFRWCGCFSVDRHDVREAVRSMRYASHLLSHEPKPLVWLFPQGVIAPPDRRPLTLYRGAAEIASRSSGTWCVPIALRYEFGGEQRPDALIQAGTPLWVNHGDPIKTVHQQLDHDLTATADLLQARWNSNDLAMFQTIVHGKTSINRLFDKIFRRK